MGRTLALLALVISSIGPVPRASADGPVVLARLPLERHDEMLAALRLELAGRAGVVDGTSVGDGVTTDEIRAEAAGTGATHVVWIAFPGGALRPAEVRVLQVARTAPAHAMTPQAWDVVDARLVAVIAGSLMDSERAAVVTATAAETETETETVAAGEPAPDFADAPDTARALGAAAPATDLDLPAVPEVALTVDRRVARRFSLIFGTGISHHHAPPPTGPFAISTGGTGVSYGHTEVAFYGRVTDWASIGLRLRLGGFGYSSIEGVVLTGALGVPSIMVSFREPLGTAAMIELGVHAEGGLFFYGRSLGEWSFGLGVGAFATLELGDVNGIQLDYTLDLYGFGDTGSYSWGSASLSYVRRFD